MASSTLLRLQIPFDVMDTVLTTLHQRRWKGVQRRGQLSRVNGTIKMQQALNIQINAKSDPFPNLLFLPQNCGHRTAATDPRTQVQPLPRNKSGSTSRLEFVISSLLVVLMRIFLKETTCIVPPGSEKVSSYSQPGGGRGEIEHVTKIKSDQRLKFSSPQ